MDTWNSRKVMQMNELEVDEGGSEPLIPLDSENSERLFIAKGD